MFFYVKQLILNHILQVIFELCYELGNGRRVETIKLQS